MFGWVCLQFFSEVASLFAMLALLHREQRPCVLAWRAGL
jgi:hypothetical protein